MSIGYGGLGEPLTYQASAEFQYAHNLMGDFSINFLSSVSSGNGFDSSALDVYINGVDHHYAFATLADAQAFFNNQTLDYGVIGGGVSDVYMQYSLTSDPLGDGFAFNYGLDYSPLASPAPEAGKGMLGSILLVLLGAASRLRHAAARG